MLKIIKNWFQGKSRSGKARRKADLRRTGAHLSPATKPAGKERADPKPDIVEIEDEFGGEVEDGGPGKNVLIRNKYVREETGTYETLTILDDSIVDSGEETGIDPYNTGDFDRSKNWDKRFRN